MTVQNIYQKNFRFSNWVLLSLIMIIPIATGCSTKASKLDIVPVNSSNIELKKPSDFPFKTSELFVSSESIGAIAIGHAEGTLLSDGRKTRLYYGHSDAANYRWNQGWCSDQGRAKGNIKLASDLCLERVQSRLDILSEDMKSVDLDPDQNVEVFINAVDLWNQAAPWVSRQFPSKYIEAIAQGKTGESAIIWARVESFKRNKKLKALGLLSICRRERREVSKWGCVAMDQGRRVKAIRAVLDYMANRADTKLALSPEMASDCQNKKCMLVYHQPQNIIINNHLQSLP